MSFRRAEHPQLYCGWGERLQMPQGCWAHTGTRSSPACSTTSAAWVQLGKACWKPAGRASPLPSSSAELTKEDQTSAPSSNLRPTAPAPHCSPLSRCWVPNSLWAPHGHTFIFNSVCLANLNNIIDFLFSWTDQSWDEHSCLAQLRGSVCSPEIYIDSHLCFQLIPIDFTLSVQMNNSVIFATCIQVGLFSSYFLKGC